MSGGAVGGCCMPPAYWLFWKLVRGLFRVLTRLDLQGEENVPRSGALIVSLNHIFILDALVIFAAVPRRMTVFAARKWRRTPFGWLMTLVARAIYVNRGEVDRVALSKALAVLRDGGTLGVAPEGTRSRTGGLAAGKDGVVYMASRTGALILPIAIWGQEQIFRAWAHLHRASVHVHIGQPIRLSPEAARARTAELGGYTEQLMLTLARMLPPEYRGVYAGKV